MMDMHSEDLIWSPASTTDTLSKEAFREGMMSWMSEFDQFTFNDRQYYPGVDDNFVPNGSVRTYGTWTGTNTASGKDFEISMYHYFTFNDDGKIINAGDYGDATGLIMAVAPDPAEKIF